ncbi:MAG TPA: hypothetical protein VLI93_06135 [Acetobacteraceae bacterium]|nr:hypothetical protein [Acetobacteraceae bacterium]
MIASMVIAAISLALALLSGALLTPGSFQPDAMHAGDAEWS